MNLNIQKRLNYLVTFLLLAGVAMFVYFFIPALRRLNSERLSVAQLQEKLTRKRQAIEGFQHPTEEEKHFWNDSKQRLKAMCQRNADTPLLNEELTKHAVYCGITDIIITPQDVVSLPIHGDGWVGEGLPSGIREDKLLLKISFHADYESLGRFLKWFDEHSHQASIFSFNVKRGLPLVSVEMEAKIHLLFCDF